MKNAKALLVFVAAGCAVCWFPSVADARIGDRFKAKRAAKQATCTTGNCTNPLHTGTGGGQLRINNKGGIEGQLPDEKYATYTDYVAAKKAGTYEGTTNISAPDVPPPPVQAAGAADVTAAAEIVELNEEALAASQDALAVAEKAKRREDERLAADLDKRIAELQRQRAALGPTPEE